MQTQIITIKPDRIENGHVDLPFDINLFKLSEKSEQSEEESKPERQLVISENKVRRAVIVDGVLVGYTHTVDFALEIVRAKFNQIMCDMFKDKQIQHFQVKYEIDQKTDNRMCKLYQVNPGFIYNGRTKLATVQVDKLPRLELRRA